MPTSNDPALERRIQRAEESLAFTEHTTDQLAGEVVAIHQALSRLTARLSALEGRLAAVERPPDTPDPEADPLAPDGEPAPP